MLNATFSSELAAYAEPVHWWAAYDEIWPGEGSEVEYLEFSIDTLLEFSIFSTRN